jgi:hypothetical protein
MANPEGGTGDMNTQYNVLLALALIGTTPPARAQGFVNLNFEQATIAPTPLDQYGPLFANPAEAFPGWTMGTDGTLNPNYTLYNNLTIGSVAQVLIGPSYPNKIGYRPLQGSYSALLQFGPKVEAGEPALSQTGMVPASAKSINFLTVSDLYQAVVTLNGTAISLMPIGGGRVAGDISVFAGQQALLKFSTRTYEGGWLYFDDVQFSAQVVPEPSALALGFLGCVALWCMKPRRCACETASTGLDQRTRHLR